MRWSRSRLASASLWVMCAFVAVAPSFAANRWAKRHYRLTDAATSERVAEISIIMNTEKPFRFRTLIEDAEGNLFVFRDSAYPDSQLVEESIEVVGTGEILQMTIDDDEITVSHGSTSFSFSDGEQEAASVQQQARQLFTAMSPRLQSIVYEFVKLGTFYYVAELEIDGLKYKDLFFLDDESLSGERRAAEIEDDLVTNFDPGTTPPNAFEQKFGPAYFQ